MTLLESSEFCKIDTHSFFGLWNEQEKGSELKKEKKKENTDNKKRHFLLLLIIPIIFLIFFSFFFVLFVCLSNQILIPSFPSVFPLCLYNFLF